MEMKDSIIWRPVWQRGPPTGEELPVFHSHESSQSTPIPTAGLITSDVTQNKLRDIPKPPRHASHPYIYTVMTISVIIVILIIVLVQFSTTLVSRWDGISYVIFTIIIPLVNFMIYYKVTIATRWTNRLRMFVLVSFTLSIIPIGFAIYYILCLLFDATISGALAILLIGAHSWRMLQRLNDGMDNYVSLRKY